MTKRKPKPKVEAELKSARIRIAHLERVVKIWRHRARKAKGKR